MCDTRDKALVLGSHRRWKSFSLKKEGNSDTSVNHEDVTLSKASHKRVILGRSLRQEARSVVWAEAVRGAGRDQGVEAEHTAHPRAAPGAQTETAWENAWPSIPPHSYTKCDTRWILYLNRKLWTTLLEENLGKSLSE